MVIGDELDLAELHTALQNAETVLRRKVGPIFLSPKDWRRKASQKGSFVGQLVTQPKLFIFGSESDLLQPSARRELDNLVRINKLKLEPGRRSEGRGTPCKSSTSIATRRLTFVSIAVTP